MIWFFERQQSRLHFEIRRQTDGHDYELVITHPDGTEEVEQFADLLQLQARFERLQYLLRTEGWLPNGRRRTDRSGSPPTSASPA